MIYDSAELQRKPPIELQTTCDEKRIQLQVW